MKDHIFRAYDIRGIVGSEFFIESTYDLGRAIAFYLEDVAPTITTVALGMDGRLHSSEIKDELARAFRLSGINVIFIGVCTTPIAYFSEYWLPVQAAIMITASHNPKEYNGIKISLGKKPLTPTALQEIKHAFQHKKYIISDIIGSYAEHDLVSDYVDYLVRLFPHLKGSAYPLVFDCGNASSGIVMRQLVEKMKLGNAVLLYDTVDGSYPHHTADPTELKNMQDLRKAVVVHGAEFGIGFDGDADRMGVITKEGNLVSGDILLSGWARNVGEHSALPAFQPTVIYDIKCSDGLVEVITQSGLTPIPSPSGHSFIKEYMRRHDAVLAGELSCHFFFRDRYFGFDDGIYAALRLLELITTYTVSLDTIVSRFPLRKNSPELRIASSHANGLIVEGVKRYFKSKKNHRITELDGIRIDTGRGWGLIRSSNTQPVVCLRFEGYSSDDLEFIKGEFIEALAPYFSKEILQQQVTW